MDKYKLFKQIRTELADGCQKELRAVDEILRRGLAIIAGGAATLEINTPNSLTSMSESGKVFREEMTQAARLILERYQSNLKKEMSGLGLYDLEGSASPAPNLTSVKTVASTQDPGRPTSSTATESAVSHPFDNLLC